MCPSACRCTADRQTAEHVHPCNTNYEYSSSSPECERLDNNPAGCVSVPTCASWVGVMEQPNGQKMCMQGSAEAYGFVVGMCLDTSGASGQIEGCYLSTTPRSCDRSPVATGAHSAGHDLAGTSAGAISDQTQATPRKFNGGNDYVQVSQNKLGTYCDVTIDTWIKFGRDALSTDQCSQLGYGWTQGTAGYAATECPGTVRNLWSLLACTPYCAALSRLSRATIGGGRESVLCQAQYCVEPTPMRKDA